MLHDKKESRKNTTAKVKEVFPHSVTMIKIEQELVIGHAKYDSCTKFLTNERVPQEKIGDAGRDQALRATVPNRPKKHVF